MAEPLKNSYNKTYMDKLAAAIHREHPEFNRRAFKRRVFNNEWEAMELKQRLSHITVCLHKTLALPYGKALTVLKKASVHFGGYEAMFFPDYVEQYGLQTWQSSIKALEHFTRYSSSEFAVRPFILQDTDRMMAQMLSWSEHSNYHVRRLSSEGCRPRLPWAMALPAFKQNPQAIFPILDNLCADESLYVRKSVANNLNDISKDNPELVLQWCEYRYGEHPLTDWIIKRACRTLLKQGNAQALQLFGYPSAKPVKLHKLMLQPERLKLGESLKFSFQLSNLASAPLRVEYAIHFCKKNGSTSAKKFHLFDNHNSQLKLEISKQHPFKPLSTRTLHAGKHALEVFVNGESKGRKTFILDI